MLPNKRDKTKITIVTIVLCAHFFFLLLPMFTSHAIKKPVKNHLVVRTLSPKTNEKKSVAPTPKKEIAKAQAPIKKPQEPQAKAPEKKPEPVKPVSQKPAVKPAPKNAQAKPVPVKTVKKESQKMKIPTDLLQELEESIAKIDKKGDKIKAKPQVASPKSQLTLSVDKIDLSVDTEEKGEKYEESLIQCLHDSLHLPDYGEVKLRLTLKEDGSVIKVTILKAESEKNKKYLELNLPHVKFPPIGGLFAQKKEHNFTLTFVNEI